MKKQFSVIKSMLGLVTLLLVVQIILLVIEFDIKRIILSCIVLLGFIANLVFYIVAKIEVNKIIFEEDGDLSIRLVDEDDYQLVRVLLDETPLENSPEECKRLSYYQSIVIDYTRLHYHYIVFDKDEAIGIFYAKNNNNLIEIEFKNELDNKDMIKNLILDKAKSTKYQVVFKE